MNAGIQGLAADIFKVALVRLDRRARATAAAPAGSSCRCTTRCSLEVPPATSTTRSAELTVDHDARARPSCGCRSRSTCVRRDLGRRQGLSAASASGAVAPRASVSVRCTGRPRRARSRRRDSSPTCASRRGRPAHRARLASSACSARATIVIDRGSRGDGRRASTVAAATLERGGAARRMRPPPALRRRRPTRRRCGSWCRRRRRRAERSPCSSTRCRSHVGDVIRRPADERRRRRRPRQRRHAGLQLPSAACSTLDVEPTARSPLARPGPRRRSLGRALDGPLAPRERRSCVTAPACAHARSSRRSHPDAHLAASRRRRA